MPFPTLQYSLHFFLAVFKQLLIIRLSNYLFASFLGSVAGFSQGRAPLSFPSSTVLPVPVLMSVGSWTIFAE